jgi:hypothetical protein
MSEISAPNATVVLDDKAPDEPGAPEAPGPVVAGVLLQAVAISATTTSPMTERAT